MKRWAWGAVLGAAVLLQSGCERGHVLDRPFNRVAGGAAIALPIFEPAPGHPVSRQTITNTDRLRHDRLSWTQRGERKTLNVYVRPVASDQTEVRIEGDKRGLLGGGDEGPAARELLRLIERHSEY